MIGHFCESSLHRDLLKWMNMRDTRRMLFCMYFSYSLAEVMCNTLYRTQNLKIEPSLWPAMRNPTPFIALPLGFFRLLELHAFVITLPTDTVHKVFIK